MSNEKEILAVQEAYSMEPRSFRKGDKINSNFLPRKSPKNKEGVITHFDEIEGTYNMVIRAFDFDGNILADWQEPSVNVLYENPKTQEDE